MVKAAKTTHSKKKMTTYILIVIFLIFISLVILGSLLPEVNVTSITLVAISPSGENVSQLPGFMQSTNSVFSYTIELTNPNYYNMTIENFSLQTNNFTLLDTNPNTPFIIAPNSSKNITLKIKLPSYAYNGSIIIKEIYKVNHAYYKYSTYDTVYLPSNEGIIVRITTQGDSNFSILTPQQYNNFSSNKPYATTYSKNLNTSSILFLNNLSSGYYYLVLLDNFSNATFNFITTKPTLYRMINGSGTLGLALSNISFVNFTVASIYPGKIHLSEGNESQLLINITQENTSDIWHSYRQLNAGKYAIEFNTTKNNTDFISINITSELVNPFHYVFQNKSSGALPIGLASYGLYNNLNSSIKTYQIKTNEAVGIANISAIKAYNATPPKNVSKYGASLQLNVMMNGYNEQGKKLTYWLQDVVSFNTSDNNFYLVDNIWNASLPRANMTEVIGKGRLSVCNYTTYNQKVYEYAYPKYYMNYSLPLSVKLIIETKGNEISFGYQILKNNFCSFYPDSFTCPTPQSTIFYDNVTIPNLNNYSIFVTPYYYTPSTLTNESNYYDAELIFGGEGNGENTTFSYMNATLNLYYDKGGILEEFPSYYSFGKDTEEGVYNLNTMILNGTGYVRIGALDPLNDINSSYSLTYLQQNYTLK
jgi:thermopsin